MQEGRAGLREEAGEPWGEEGQNTGPEVKGLNASSLKA